MRTFKKRIKNKKKKDFKSFIRKREIETEMLGSGEKAILPKPKNKERRWQN